MMDNLKAVKEARQQLNNPREAEKIRRWATLLAEKEEATRMAVRRLYQALDDAPCEAPPPLDVEERTNTFCDMVAVQTPGGDGLAEVWLRHCTPAGVEIPKRYLGMADDDWREQLEEWRERYNEAGVDGDRDEISDMHLREQYDLGREEFEDLIIGWDTDQAILDLMVGPTDETEQAMLDVEEALGEA